jgi:hypothetical protein
MPVPAPSPCGPSPLEMTVLTSTTAGLTRSAMARELKPRSAWPREGPSGDVARGDWFAAAGAPGERVRPQPIPMPLASRTRAARSGATTFRPVRPGGGGGGGSSFAGRISSHEKFSSAGGIWFPAGVSFGAVSSPGLGGSGNSIAHSIAGQPVSSM